MPLISIILAAGGIGRRMGLHIPKQLLKIGDITILELTLKRFIDLPNLIDIIIPAPKEYVSVIQEIADKYSDYQIKVIEGGEQRSDSVYNGLLACSSESEIVLIHDAVRPFFAESVITEALEALQSYDGATAAIPVVYTIKEVENDNVLKTIPRENLVQVNTPQLFNKKQLIKAHQFCKKESISVTDDAMMIEMTGGKIKIIQDSVFNIKVTTPFDIKSAELILQQIQEEKK